MPRVGIKVMISQKRQKAKNMPNNMSDVVLVDLGVRAVRLFDNEVCDSEMRQRQRPSTDI